MCITKQNLAAGSTLSRGLAYARQGRAVIEEYDADTLSLSGYCWGSRDQRYSVRVEYRVIDGYEVDLFEGYCSCPVGWNCKHCVALLAAAVSGSWMPESSVMNNDPFSEAQSIGGTSDQRHSEQIRQPAWRSALLTIFTDGLSDSDSEESAMVPIGVAVDFSAETEPQIMRNKWRNVVDFHYISGGYSFYRAAGSVRLRPVKPGKRQNWIRSGVSWNGIYYGHTEQWVPHQRAATRHFLELCFQTLGQIPSSNSPLDLGDAGNQGLWSALRDMVEAGVVLLDGDGKDHVTLESSPASASISIVENHDSSLTLSAEAHHEELTSGAPMALLGNPAHGVAWQDQRGLHLAPFDKPVHREWSLLREEDHEVMIPSEDVPEFLRSVFPSINRLGWHSPDGSFEGPTPLRPRLQLVIDASTRTESASKNSRKSPHTGGYTPRARLEWGWIYGDEDDQTRAPLPLAASLFAVDRDLKEEQSLVGEVLGELIDQVPTLPKPMFQAPRGGQPSLRPTCTLWGMEVVTLVNDIVPLLDDLDVIVKHGELPHLRESTSATVLVDVDPASTSDWLDLEITVEVEGHSIPVASLIQALTRGESAVFLPEGVYLSLDNPDLDKLRHLLEEARGLSDQRREGVRVPSVRLSWWEELLNLEMVQTSQAAWFARLRQALAAIPEIARIPTEVAATLRDYQVTGFQWLAGLRRLGLGGVLADDMGLGKTIQTLAMIADQRSQLSGGESAESPPWLVVAPTSVVANWADEAATFTPGLRTVVITGTEARLGIPLSEVAGGADLVVTSFALLRLDAKAYSSLTWAGMIIDEAQNAKNPGAKVFSALVGVGAPIVYAITGTPIENNLGELWAVFGLTAPGLLGTHQQFNKTFRKPIEGGGDLSAEAMNRLRRRIAPFLLRRTKEDVSLQLPPKQEQVLRIELGSAHRRVYNRHLQRERQRVLGLLEEIDSNQIEILSALTRLRQLAIDPALVEEDTQAHSSKLETLIPLLEEAAIEGHRVVVFSQFTRFLRKIATHLDQVGIDYSYLDGATSNRQQVIDGFRNGSAPIFLMSLKAGGVGINLTEADYAILTDPWWNPATESQAVARTYRIGQERPVMVYRLVSEGTIEEKMLTLQDSKRALAHALLAAEPDSVGGSSRQTGGTRLTVADVHELLD